MEKYEGKTWLQIAQEIKPDITEDEVENILWNETCYPFDTETALKELIKILTNG